MAITDITQIPAPRVPFIDERTKLISREWYRWFINIFNLTGAGQSDATIIDLLITPPSTTNQEAKFAESEKQLQSLEMKAAMWESYVAESEKQLQSLEMKAAMWESYIAESEKQLQSLMLSPRKEDADFDLAAAINAATSKTTPVDSDEFALTDSASAFTLKKLTWANLKATAKTYFDTLYLGVLATAADASKLLGGTWAAPGAIGSSTPSTGIFTSAKGIKSGQTDYSNAGLESQSASGDVHISLHAAGASATSIKHARGGNGIEILGTNGVDVADLKARTLTSVGGAVFQVTSTALSNGAGAGAGTITNAPTAGNPTKWIGINDNGTIRYIPSW